MVSLVVAFSHFMDNTFTPGIKSAGERIMGLLLKGEGEEEEIGKLLLILTITVMNLTSLTHI